MKILLALLAAVCLMSCAVEPVYYSGEYYPPGYYYGVYYAHGYYGHGGGRPVIIERGGGYHGGYRGGRGGGHR